MYLLMTQIFFVSVSQGENVVIQGFVSGGFNGLRVSRWIIIAGRTSGE
jgi:hypothetical protein